jgi:3-hydroxybutyryl-CoA dehydrogenase
VQVIAIITATEQQKQELTAQGLLADLHLEWNNTLQIREGAAIYIDLLFDNSPERIKQLTLLPAQAIFINWTAGSLKNLPDHFIRFNGWPSFLQRNIVEAAAPGEEVRKIGEEFFASFNKKVEWLNDTPGFISARVIAMIINEAYYALEERVSTKEEIDTAMKLGTSYPFGPFEWAEKIGLKKVYDLLLALATINTRYLPAPLLKKEALQ